MRMTFFCSTEFKQLPKTDESFSQQWRTIVSCHLGKVLRPSISAMYRATCCNRFHPEHKPAPSNLCSKMSRDDRVKILVVGPPKSGKTCVANFLGGARDAPTDEYKETAPLRILETVLDGLSAGGAGGRGRSRGVRATVEIWDVGGSSKYQSCWTAIKKDADGVIFVMNPEIEGQERELELWFKNFVEGLPNFNPAERCAVFCHHSSAPQRAVGRNARPDMPQCLRGVPVFETSLDFQSDNFKEALEKLVEISLMRRREAEENAALKSADVMSGAIMVGGARGEN
jgi:GTPase SAR1 family protein